MERCKKKKPVIYKTIRIYALDHELLLKRFSRIDNFAEIINQLVNDKIRGLK